MRAGRHELLAALNPLEIPLLAHACLGAEVSHRCVRGATSCWLR